MSSLRNTTLPGVAARLPPTVEAAGVDLARPALVVDQVVEEVRRALDQARRPRCRTPASARPGSGPGSWWATSASSATFSASSAFCATSASTAAAPTTSRAYRQRRQVGQPHPEEERVRAPRRVGEPPVLRVDRHGRVDLAAEPRGWRRPSGSGRGPSTSCSVARAGAAGFGRLDCSASSGPPRSRPNPGPRTDRTRVPAPLQLARRHRATTLHHVSILRGKPRASHPLPLTGISHAAALCDVAHSPAVDVLLVTADGARAALGRRAGRAARRRCSAGRGVALGGRPGSGTRPPRPR